ncbi:MAG: DUF4105 domain-containing protein [Gemmatimonadetes bacterium]|nr:DUF4105 domain-containing protein [Gemmatimonadota bacterium]NIR81365.1 DUF4105 domain-containing protein [Gemmatimonadota bacterium]NIT88044.1 DUF4105 domain-containing protein [Gemmatimonadota bacterium]NIU34025.1 DUF4105 domain-containing protein [Gemmatimonadota bacterium]NIU36487.1 DUF4105 domain-containing protein [Gemmatimonadota bacterium]
MSVGPGRLYLALGLAGLAVLVLPAVWWAVQRPSDDREWQPNMAVLPWAEFTDSLVRVHNVRNTEYRSVTDYTPRYDDRVYDLRDLDAVWFVVEPFAEWHGVAHTFLTFGFGDRQFVSISVEARKERGEEYNALKGLFRRYELMYVVADERDAIGLRVGVRGNDVFLYPMRAPVKRIRDVFVSMLERANALREAPRFYNTLTENCTNTLAEHVNALVPGRIPFSYRLFLPGYSDELAYDLGLIDTDLPFEEARRRFRIDPRGAADRDAEDFSLRIRELGG